MGLGGGRNEAGESREQHDLRKKNRLTICSKAAECDQTITMRRGYFFPQIGSVNPVQKIKKLTNISPNNTV